MEIRDLDNQHEQLFFKCLEDWSDDMAESGDRRKDWFTRMSANGLRAKLAFDDNGVLAGMIQYLPIEYSHAEGAGLHFINCIWVHGHKKGRGNFQGRGMGSELLKAAEEDARSLGSGGMVAWGLSMPFWMRASWFKKHGYAKTDKDGMSVLLWKPFSKTVHPPKWILPRKKPVCLEDKVTVTSFNSGWCSVQNLAHERAKRAAAMHGDNVHFDHIDTMNRETMLEWGISDALFIDGKQVRTGPPPSFEKIKNLVDRRVRKLR
ncbi:MAG: GNAT family N-acetyltransferase [Candidatus Thermoplasmatota archaeon]|nr:GNAT family N-acetyltransferase [Candidatus Thermoplasmatota archaeon]